MKENIYDFKIGEIVPTPYFGERIDMRVVGHDELSQQVKVQYLDAFGSCYYSVADLNRFELQYNG